MKPEQRAGFQEWWDATFHERSDKLARDVAQAAYLAGAEDMRERAAVTAADYLFSEDLVEDIRALPRGSSE